MGTGVGAECVVGAAGENSCSADIRTAATEGPADHDVRVGCWRGGDIRIILVLGAGPAVARGNCRVVLEGGVVEKSCGRACNYQAF